MPSGPKCLQIISHLGSLSASRNCVDSGSYSDSPATHAAWTLKSTSTLNVRTFWLLAAALVMGGCADSMTPSSSPFSRPAFSFSTSSTSPGPNSPGPFNLQTYPYPTLALISVSGLVHVEYPPAEDGSPRPPHDSDYRGVYFNGGCYEAVSLWTHSGWDVVLGGGCPPVTSAGTEYAWTNYAYIGGTTGGTYTGTPPGGGDGIYSGNFTLLVTPIDGDVSMDASSHAVVRGATVSFTAAIFPSSIGGRPLPNTLNWRYVTTGGQSVYPCGPTSPCDYAPQSSGTMYLDAVINNVAKPKSEPITIMDSLPPIPPDSEIPGVGGGGGGSGGGSGGGGTVPTLDLTCVSGITGSTSIERATEVVCTVSLSNGATLPLSVLKALPLAGQAGIWYTDASPVANGLSTPYQWRGIAVDSAKVFAGLTYYGRSLANTATFIIIPRTWSNPTMPAPIADTALGAGMTPYPSGLFGLHSIGFDATGRVSSVSDGPNDGIWYISSPLALWDSIWVHPALSPAKATGQSLVWYNDQNGFPANTCGSTQVATLLSTAVTHEGVTQAANSHWGHWAASLPTSGIGASTERVLFLQQSAAGQVILQATAGWASPQWAAEHNWDTQTEYPRIFGLSGLLQCNLDYSLTDGG